MEEHFKAPSSKPGKERLKMLVLLKPLGQALIISDVPPEPLRETLLAAT